MYSPFILMRRAVAVTAAAAVIALAASSWQKEDPAQWTSEDVYQVLNNSPWSKSVQVVESGASGPSEGRGGAWGEGPPGGGMGRMGGGGGLGGMGRGRGGPARNQNGPTVTVQWASALPVRLAEAKSSSAAADPAGIKPDDRYVIAVIGFPKSGFEPRQSGADPSDTPDDATLADHLKVITVLSIGQERLNPVKVELNQGRDGRAVFYFERAQDVTVRDKDAEFRIGGQRMDIRKKFPLKDMQFQGKLQL